MENGCWSQLLRCMEAGELWGSPRGRFLGVPVQAVPQTGSVPLRRLPEDREVLIGPCGGGERLLSASDQIRHLVISRGTQEAWPWGRFSSGLP